MSFRPWSTNASAWALGGIEPVPAGSGQIAFAKAEKQSKKQAKQANNRFAGNEHKRRERQRAEPLAWAQLAVGPIDRLGSPWLEHCPCHGGGWPIQASAFVSG